MKQDLDFSMLKRRWVNQFRNYMFLFVGIVALCIIALQFLPNKYEILSSLDYAMEWYIAPLLASIFVPIMLKANSAEIKTFAAKNGFQYTHKAPMRLDGYSPDAGLWLHAVSGEYADKQFTLGVGGTTTKEPIGHYEPPGTAILILNTPPASKTTGSQLFFKALDAFGAKPEIKYFSNKTYFIIKAGFNKTPEGMQKIFDFIADYS